VTAFLAELSRRDAVLWVTGLVQLTLAAAFAIGLGLDDRVLLGVSPWLKPLKFALSITIYVWTVAWLLGDVRASAPGAARVISVSTSVAMLAEIACIALQSLRGVPSHFNDKTAFDAGVFGVMGVMILLNTLLAAVLLFLYLTVPSGLPGPYLWAVRLGLVLFLFGSAVGPMMVSRGAHTVGVPDGGPGLPFVNWSTKGGDLRVVHALGLHALQILPLAASALLCLGRLSGRQQTALVIGLAAVYALAMVSVLRQALAGHPPWPLR
jgi:hypothetical protein